MSQISNSTLPRSSLLSVVLLLLVCHTVSIYGLPRTLKTEPELDEHPYEIMPQVPASVASREYAETLINPIFEILSIEELSSSQEESDEKDLDTCDKRFYEIYPETALDKRYHQLKIVHLLGDSKPIAKKCRYNNEFCRDSHTPENYVKFCKSKIKWVKILTQSEEGASYKEATVAMSDGCSCKLVPDK